MDLSSTGRATGVPVPPRKGRAAKMHGWPNEVDVLGDVLRKRVTLMATDPLVPTLAGTIDVILGPKDDLGLSDGDVQLDCVAIAIHLNIVRVNTEVVDEPRVDDVDRLLGWSESLGDLRRRPVVAVVRRMRVGDVDQVRVQLVQV